MCTTCRRTATVVGACIAIIANNLNAGAIAVLAKIRCCTNVSVVAVAAVESGCAANFRGAEVYGAGIAVITLLWCAVFTVAVQACVDFRTKVIVVTFGRAGFASTA